MGFTVLSWNVEFFGSRRPGEATADVAERIDNVFDLLAQPSTKADVFAIYEVNGSQVFEPVKTAFPDYVWTISEGPGSQQILVGARVPAFVTHRSEFSHGFTGPLRPGLLVTVTDDGHDYPILFLHLKAADAAIDFGVRVHQHEKARSLRRALDGVGQNGDRANFIVAGDFNNVGMGLTFSDRDITLDDERDRIRTMYQSHYDRMVLLPKSAPVTFWNGPGSSDRPSDIDHVLAAAHIDFAALPGGARVEVLGWPQEPTDAAQADWIRRFSDHAILRFTVNGVS